MSSIGGGRQGIYRKIDTESLRLIDIVVSLARIGIPAGEALAIARGVGDGVPTTIAGADFLSLRYDRAAHEADLGSRLREATERVVPRSRGRPPSTSRQRKPDR